MAERGAIYNRAKAKQLINFSGLQFDRGITPTDIDGFLDFDNRVFVFLEYKTRGIDLPYGQRLALERMAKASHAAGRVTYVLIGEHSNALEEDIDGAAAKVREVWSKYGWQRPGGEFTVRSAIEWILTTHI